MTDGLLLAGGASRRFGADKRFAELGAASLVETSLARLRAVCSGTVFIGSGARRELLPGTARHVRIADAVPGRGPLGAVVAGLRRAPTGLLVLACDVPDVPVAVLDAVVRAGAREQRPAAPLVGGRWEPLVAYYPRRVLFDLEAALREKLLAPHRLLDRIGCIAVRNLDGGRLANVNRPRDLDSVLARRKRR